MKHDHSFDHTQLSLAEKARISCEVEMKLMGECAENAFSLGYVPTLARAARRETFARARRRYDEAKRILECTL